ncbi:response regulator transcription factor [Dyella telluris]|uniref:Response regulator transcription factor n=1 Tax=Dyella telluris TaxID=2763498 RepID=A0A7G8Q3W3_9GAMM|nr:response regulator transcription factor [Dyella telluris]QNK01471.1 response regulator transcription factor [Dyella telluris]
MSIRAFLADDHPIVRASVSMEISRMSDVHVVGEASTADELITFIRTGACDLLVTDFNMPGNIDEDGLAMLDAIRRLQPTLPVIVLTMLTNSALLRAIHERGIAGIVIKSDGMSELASALRAVVAGDIYVSANARALFQTATRRDAAAPGMALTDREAEVLRLFASGRTVSEIAVQRGRSVKTISHQKISAMNKLGLRNDPELYTYAHEHGLC